MSGFDNNKNDIDFPANDNSTSFKFKQKTAGETGNHWTKDVETMVLLKYLNNFWRTLEMQLINCEISFMLNCSQNCLYLLVLQ